MSLRRKQVELVVIRDPYNPQDTIEYYSGRKLEPLIKQAFPQGISDSLRFYHGSLLEEVFKLDERQDKDAVKALCALKGRVYVEVRPQGLGLIPVFLVGSAAVAGLGWLMQQLMPMPEMPTNNMSQPASPNNALARRTNEQRLGGRVADIFGEVWSVPDLIAPTYSIYIDNQEVEYSYMCVGRGKYDVKNALDDTTPVAQVFGSGVLVYDPQTTLEDTPAFVFGEQFDPNEAEFARLAAKRYTSVNGQTLTAPDAYLSVKVSFKNPNIIETTDNVDFNNHFKVGDLILIEGAVGLASGNNLLDGDGQPITYTLNGQFTVQAVSDKQLTINASNNAEWQKLADNVDFTVESDSITLSTEKTPLWQGYFYTSGSEHDSAYVNVTAQGLYDNEPSGRWKGLRIYGSIESEIVDSNDNPIEGTLHTQQFTIESPNGDKYQWEAIAGGWDATTVDTSDDKLRTPAGVTIKIENPHFSKGKRLRFRIARTSNVVTDTSGGIVDEVKVKDFYGVRLMTGSDYPQGVTTVYAKTLATEGALALKERKLKLLVERYITDYETKDLKLSRRADDIIYHLATDPIIGGLTDEQVDFEQIKGEIDILINYFGSSRFAEFCHTFDDTNLSSEESIQAVAAAVFSNAKRAGNKLQLDFERSVPASVAVFNSHNILPDSFSAPESFGIVNDYDGAKVEFIDPVDDAQVTKSYPNDALTNPHTQKLIGVRNELQATAHMMRLYNKDRYAYKSCEFSAGDESNIVVRTNRITVANQLRADVQQGSVESIEVVGSDIVLHTTDPVSLSSPAHLFIQTINNGVESIPIEPHDTYSVKLSRLPSGAISTDANNEVVAVYHIVSSSNGDKDAYIVTQKDPSDGMINKLTCINYDERFYQNDKDHLNPLNPYAL